MSGNVSISLLPKILVTLGSIDIEIWKGRSYSVTVRSPDLNPLHSLLWGYLKAFVYEIPMETHMDLLASKT